jgi:Trk K+ transport system NAD-binding subunit
MGEATAAVSELESLRDHVVILNVNEKVHRIVEEIQLGSRGAAPDIVIMVQDMELWEAHPRWHPRDLGPGRLVVASGCPAEPEDLARVRIERARAAVILADPAQGELADAHSTLVAVAVERRDPQVHTVMELIASVNRAHLRRTEVNEVVCLGELSENLIAQSCITPGIARVLADLLHAHPGTTQIFVVDLPEDMVGLSYRQLARRALERRAPFTLCGFVRERGSGAPEAASYGKDRGGFVLNPRAGVEPGKDTRLAQGDRLVVIGYSAPVLDELI